MSYNGSGTFNINSAGQPVVTGTTITSTAFNLLTADLATGLSTAMTKDGQSTPTANIPMGTFKLTGLGAGTAATDAAQYGQLQAGATTIAVVTGTDTLTGTLTPAITAYATGNLFSFVAANTNTGAATIALNGLAAKNITKLGSTALAAGDIVSGRVYLIEYDGTRFQLLNPSASSVASFSAGSTGFTPSSATTGAVTLAGTLATTNGGTGLTSYTANGVLYASSSSALTSGSALTFDGTNLGVGVTNPAAYGKLALNGSANVLNGNFLYMYDSGNTNGPGMYAPGDAFAWKNSAGSTEWMRINGTGLGIGTSSPAQKLHVLSSAQNIARFESSNTESNIRFDNSGATVNLFGTAGANFYWYSGSTERMRLDSSGNLGLGVTPSAWLTVKAMQLGSYGQGIAGGTGQTGMYVGSNNYYGSGGWTYTTTAYATQYKQNESNSGSHAWMVAPSGTAGNAITFTQAMTLGADGRLLLGQTSATNGANTTFECVNSGANQSAYFGNLASSGTIYGISVLYKNQAPNNTSSYFIYCEDNAAARFYVQANGGIANYATNNVILSDRREKTNFAPATSYLEKICAIPVQTFNYIDQNLEEDGGLTLGIVAQDVQSIAPELVTETNWGTEKNPKMRLSIYQTDLQYAMMKALQELKAEFDAYKASHP